MMIRSRSLLSRLGEQCGSSGQKGLISLLRVEIILRNERSTEDYRQMAAREIGRAMWTSRTKGFDFFNASQDLNCGTKEGTEDYREQTVARGSKGECMRTHLNL